MARETVRLDKLLSNLGYCSRAEVKYLLKEEVILVDGQPVIKPDLQVLHSQVTFDSETLDPPNILIAFHKPVGYICSHKENEGRLIYELLPERWKFRKPTVTTVGRLDKETSGLIIITDNGDLNHKLSQPSRVAKVYQLETRDPFRGDEKELFASGTFCLSDDPDPLLPAEFKLTSTNTAKLTLHEGRYHQVRRMFSTIGNEVIKLHRISIGGLKVDEIPSGKWIDLDSNHLDLLFQK